MAEAVRDSSENVVRVNVGTERARRVPAEVAPASAPSSKDAANVAPAAQTQRIASVDALRGFTIFWIIGGDGLAWALQDISKGLPAPLAAAGHFIGTQLTHVAWEGFRFYDLIFPLFVFTVGVAIVLSLPRLVEREGQLKAHARVVRRALLLFALGLLYYGGTNHLWPDVRLLGVLQRLALCYLFASLLFLHLRLRGLIAALMAILLGYWALMTFVPIPGMGAPSYEEGFNLANWIDLHYLPGKKWNDTWDPEGLLSTLPAIGTCLIGVLVGKLLMSPHLQPQRKSLWLAAGGVLMVLAGYLWGLQFPVIKNIWTSSFVLVAGGYSLLLLGVMHQIIDVWGIKAWATVFVWIGANAIALYFLNGIIGFGEFATRLVGGDVGDFLDRALTHGAGSLAVNVVGLAIAVALAGFLYRRKIFLRV